MIPKVLFFDIDDTLYDSSSQVRLARENAVRAMIEAGLEVEEKRAWEKLQKIVEKFGPNYQYHLNELLKELDYNKNPRIVAAGIVAYHNAKRAHTDPFPDTVPTLLKLKEEGYVLGSISDGLAVKQWEKLIRLGLQHFFSPVIISEEIGAKKPSPKIFKEALLRADCEPEKAMMIGNRLDRDISGANKVGLTTIKIQKGKYKNQKPQKELEKPDYVISRVGEIKEILEKIKEKNKKRG